MNSVVVLFLRRVIIVQNVVEHMTIMRNIENAKKDMYMNQNANKIVLLILGGILLVGALLWVILFVLCPELMMG